MGCGCTGGSGDTTGSSRRLNITKQPGYTWNGPNEDDEVVEDDDESTDDDEA